MKLGKIHESPVSKKASGKRSSLTLRSSKRNSINNCQIGEPQFDDNRVLAQDLVGANGVSMSATLPSEVAMNPKICESSSNTLQDDGVSLSQDRREQDSEENFTGGEEEELKEEDHKGHDSNEDEHVDKDDKDEDEKWQKEVEEEVGEGDEADKNGEKDEEDDDDDMTLDRLVAKPLYRKVSARAVSDKIKEDAGVKTIADDVDDCFTLQSLKVVAKEETHHFISKTGFKVSPVASDGVQESIVNLNPLAEVAQNLDLAGNLVLNAMPVAVRAARSKFNSKIVRKQSDSKEISTKKETPAIARSNPKEESLAVSKIDISHVLLSSGGVSKGRRAARKPKSVVKFEFLSSQTVDRKMRKRKQNDMASDGDLEWDALMGDADGTRDANGVDRPGRGKSKLESGSSLAGYSISGEVAAVAAGLRARAPGPTEKVRFKDVLKRRGGLQEYIECRNMVLSLWEKDVQHILSVNDCGVSPVRKEGESPRATLIRDIFEFLNYHGHINIGVAKKKLKPCSSEEQVTEEVLNAPRLVLTSFPTLKGFDDVTLQDENINDYLEAKEETEEEAATWEAENSNYIREVVETGLECSHTLEDNLLAVVKDHNLYTTAGNARKRTLEESEALLPSKKQFVVKETLPYILDSSGNFESATKPLSMEDVNFSSFDENHSLEDKAQSEVVGSAIFDVREDRLHCDREALRNVESLKSAMLRKQEIEKIKAEAHIESEDILELSNQPEIKHSLAFERHSMSDKVDRTEVPQTLRKCETRDNITANEQMREVGNGSIFPEPDQKSSGRQKHIIVVGAGPAGLAASRQMQRMNLKVTVLEARDRVGGRVYTDRCTFSVPVDLGASIITGVEADVTTERRADPSSLLCKQLGLQLTTLRGDCPLYDSVTGLKVPADVDEELEAEYNSLLDDTVVLVAQNGDKAMRMSLEEGLEKALKKRRTVQHFKQEVKDNRMDGVISPLPCQKTTQVGIKESFQDSGDSSIREENDGAVSCQYVHRQIEFSSSGALRDFCHDSFSETLKFDEEKASNQVVGTISEPNIDPSNVEPPSEISQGLQLGSLNLSELERRIMDWHFANLEYGCAAQLCQVSLPYWNQDDAYGGFGGPHCMIKEGYGTLMEALAEGLDIRLGQVVTEIKYMVPESQNRKDCDGKVKVKTMSGDEFVGDAVLVTVPLGCLKADTIKFLPSLPLWKSESIKRLGFGTLNKVVLEFPVAFWDDSVDYFGATAKNTESRGRCFMFWNLKRTACAPILVALVVGQAALEEEKNEKSQLIRHALNVLRKLFGEEAVPEPKASAVTNWGCEQYSRGAYSYVALGASGEDYDILGRPVENCIFFAGEATCKEHPDTVGGAFMSGLREAIRIVGILENHEDVTLEAENSRGTQRQSESERNEVRDMAKRLAAADLSTVLLGEGATLDAEQKPFTRADLLKDMFSSANTAAGRLLVAKEMLQEPISVVKAFAGTKAGLTVLNTWILVRLYLF
ncbi:hypothetical protein O6H91_21G012200 [Diphasiastrum complanatum]|uniref:Uncharacterized protein n=1 Tax=Diphasiastrum complanatum TaxID=34168 RepID=A0ACC2AHZ6_DIPCM|nr:hypothetical protein O6H91_21G012200 [Diphasiastrum complanatum]